MWVAQHCRFNHPRNPLTSGALGTMGLGLPAAMGAQFACPDRTVVLVSGDGSFMMNVQELATIARCRLPVKIVLLDNSSLGMVRQWQELFFAERYSEIDLSDNPDFVALAQVFGIAATRIDARDDVEGGLAALLAEPGPALLHVAIDARANVWPLRAAARDRHGRTPWLRAACDQRRAGGRRRWPLAPAAGGGWPAPGGNAVPADREDLRLRVRAGHRRGRSLRMNTRTVATTVPVRRRLLRRPCPHAAVARTPLVAPAGR
ncbi:hypothetical protein G6F24_013878 [Rhizopus arrhizus]|nr:hypothetical protein G6F24_013878 [Rhizopus arrhizus]